MVTPDGSRWSEIGGNDMTPTPTANGPGARAASLAGIGSAVALVLSVAILSVPTKASDDELITWWSKSGNQSSAVASMFLMGAAGMLFLGMLGRLRTRLAESGPSGRRTSAMVYGAGITFVAGLAVAGTLRGAIGRAVLQHDEPLPDVDLLRYLPQLASAALGVFAMGAAVVAVVATAVATLRDRAFARWHAILGIVVGLGATAAIAAGFGELAIPLLAVWLIATAVVLGRTDASARPDERIAARPAITPGVQS